MRTPGDDFDLAAGFLFTEGVIGDREMIEGFRHWGAPNVVRVGLREGTRIDTDRLHRHFYATSSCGICGKSSIEAIRVKASRLQSDVRVTAQTLNGLSETLRTSQQRFAETGGLHAAGLFTTDGKLMLAREDVGRHNAVDKVIGHQFMNGR